MTTLDSSVPATESAPLPAATAPRPRDHWWIRQDRPAWALPAHAGVTILAAVLYTWGLSSSVGMGNTFYAAAVEGGNGELEGVLVRFPRPGELHHRRQASCLAVGHGALGADLRLLQLEHAPPRGVGRRGHRRRALPSGASLVRRCCGTLRRLGHGRHSHRRRDVPRQQSRRPVDPASRAQRVGARVGPRVGADVAVGALRGPPGPRLHHQDAPGLHRRPGLRARLPVGRTAPARPAGRPVAVGRSRPCRLEQLVGRHRRALAGVLASFHREQHQQLRAQSHLRLQRIRAPPGLGERSHWRYRFPGRRISRHRRPGGLAPHVQRPRRRTDLLADAARPLRPPGRLVAHPTRLPSGSWAGPASCCGAAGCSSPLRSSARPRASSTPTTRWPWLLPSPRAPVRAPSPFGVWDGSAVGSPSSSPPPSSRARCGRQRCSTGIPATPRVWPHRSS